jgi:hypothetical protein
MTVFRRPVLSHKADTARVLLEHIRGLGYTVGTWQTGDRRLILMARHQKSGRQFVVRAAREDAADGVAALVAAMGLDSADKTHKRSDSVGADPRL